MRAIGENVRERNAGVMAKVLAGPGWEVKTHLCPLATATDLVQPGHTVSDVVVVEAMEPVADTEAMGTMLVTWTRYVDTPRLCIGVHAAHVPTRETVRRADELSGNHTLPIDLPRAFILPRAITVSARMYMDTPGLLISPSPDVFRTMQCRNGAIRDDQHNISRDVPHSQHITASSADHGRPGDFRRLHVLRHDLPVSFQTQCRSLFLPCFVQQGTKRCA